MTDTKAAGWARMTGLISRIWMPGLNNHGVHQSAGNESGTFRQLKRGFWYEVLMIISTAIVRTCIVAGPPFTNCALEAGSGLGDASRCRRLKVFLGEIGMRLQQKWRHELVDFCMFFPCGFMDE